MLYKFMHLVCHSTFKLEMVGVAFCRTFFRYAQKATKMVFDFSGKFQAFGLPLFEKLKIGL